MNDVIPDDWELVNLGTLGSFAKGAGIRKDEALSGEIPAVRYGELYTDHPEILRAHRSFISLEISKSARQIKCGDILFAGSGETKEEIGKCTGFLGDYEAFAGGDIIVFRPNGPDPRFLAYMLNSASIAKQKAQRAQGDAVVHIYPDALSRLSLPLPPFHEQQAIAAALSDADGVVAGLERVIAKKRLIKQGAMQDLLTARRRLPGFTGEWEVKFFGQIAKIRNAKVQTFGNPVAQNCIELEQVEHETGRILFWADATTRTTVKYAFEMGDVLFGRLRPYLRKFHRANKEGVCSTEIWPLMSQGIDSGFLYQVVQSDGFIAAACEAYGTHMPRADWGKIATYQIQVPVDLKEQEAIGDVLADMETEIQSLESRLTKARAVKEGMMQNLLTGRVRLV
ncbi:restriction endonuclease subunit S [Phaeobacter sp. SYSU ZJ3003]|uniref:restriction endonuclease subunit S n=1 Tax=Phaeobacter sp. SYSU ZJ3003 TaxID=2109330 RepID=UPI00351BF7BE